MTTDKTIKCSMGRKNLWIHLMLIIIWISLLLKSYYYPAVYILTGIMGIIALLILRDSVTIRLSRDKCPEILVSTLFSFAVMLANTNLASDIRVPDIGSGVILRLILYAEVLLSAVLLFFGGFICAYYSLELLCHFASERTANNPGLDIKAPSQLFFASFLMIVVLYSLILFLGFYPGIMNPDSFSQLKQVLSGEYDNYNPYYHTRLMGLIINAGLLVFGEINAAIACFVVFQIICIAAVFAYAVVTLYQVGMPSRAILITGIIVILLPFNILYSLSVYKEGLFAASVLVLTITLFRLIENVGDSRLLNMILLVVGTLGTCLFRHNGFYSLIVFVILYLLVCRRRYLIPLVAIVITMIVSFVLIGPMVNAIHRHEVRKQEQVIRDASDDIAVLDDDHVETQMEGPRLLHNFSIPMQQIARVICKTDDLTDDQLFTLNHIMKIDEVPDEYAAWNFDSIAALIGRTGGNEYFNAHKGECIRLYFELGLKHPADYIKAWADQTSGYWDIGTTNWYLVSDIEDNDIGAYMTPFSSTINAILNAYLWSFSNVGVLAPIISIGIYTWGCILTMYIGVRKRKMASVMCALIPLSIIIILCLTTPINYERRYASSVMMIMPFLMVLALFGTSSDTLIHQKNSEDIESE